MIWGNPRAMGNHFCLGMDEHRLALCQVKRPSQLAGCRPAGSASLDGALQVGQEIVRRRLARLHHANMPV